MTPPSTALPSLPVTITRVSTGADVGSLVFFPDFGGSTLYARHLIAELGKEIRCLALRLAPDMIENLPRLSLEEISRRFAQDILDAGLPRPLHLVGFSFAGFLAHETGRQMALLGEPPDRVWIYDLLVYSPLSWRMILDEPVRHGTALAVYFAKNWRRVLLGKGQADTLHAYGLVRVSLSSHPESYRFIMRNLYQAMEKHRPQPSPVATSVVRALQNKALKRSSPDLGWLQFAEGPFSVESVPGDHLSMLRSPENALIIADITRRAFRAGAWE